MNPELPDPGPTPDEPAFVREWRLPATRREDLTSHMRTFLDEAMQGNLTWKGEVSASIWARIHVIDAALARQLATIRNHPDFQQLEARWRELRSLVDRTEASAE
jgi:predicted component of type VI protein secretion system